MRDGQGRSLGTIRLLATLAVGAAAAGLMVGLTQHESSGSAKESADPPALPAHQVTVAHGPGAPSCDATLDALPTRTQLGQLLVVGVPAGSADAAIQLVRDDVVSGIFVHDDAMKLLSGNALAAVTRTAPVAPLVAVDDEGGRVQTIDPVAGDLPSPRTMAASMTADQVQQAAAKRGRYLRAAGVTMDFAPVADVTAAPADTVIGDRSFSADPATARRYTTAFAKGLASAGVLPVLKHFPGHGHGSGDSHTGVVTTPDLARLERADLVPYQHISDYGQTAVMLGHLDVPGLTGGVPASLSPAAYQLLHDKYGFNGLTVTDDLGAMKAVSSLYDLPQAVLKAINAGADMALWSSGERADEVLNVLTNALKSGQLSPQRARDAERHVLIAKGVCR